MAYKSFHLKNGRLRLYSGGTVYFLEVPFRGAITGPVDRPRPQENLILDRGRATSDAHFVVGGDDVIYAPLPISFNFRLANTEPSLNKLIQVIRNPANTGLGVAVKLIGSAGGPNRGWTSTKGSTQIRSGRSDGIAQDLVTTPPFSDAQKWCCNVEVLWEDTEGGAGDQGFRWAEVYFPQDRTVTEGDLDVMVDMSGECYGAVTPILAFSAGTES